MELLLIRHGLPVRLESDRPVDPPLAPLGHLQAEALADWLAETPPDVVITSTMARAVETGAHVAEAFDLKPVADDDFCEFDRGTNAYIPLEELDRDHPHMKQLIDDWVGPGGAERRGVFQARVMAALDRTLGGLDAGRVALVCHGGVINVILAHVLGLEPAMFFKPDYTSISRVGVGSSQYRLLSVNEAGHLRAVADS